MWRPLITDANERARLLGIVREIAQALHGAPVGVRRVATHCDHAVLHAYLSADNLIDSHLGVEHLAAAISAQAGATNALGLHDGVAGVGWTIAHLANDANAEELCGHIDEVLLRAVGAWRDRYDLISGLVGIGVYALEREQAGRPLAARIVRLLAERARPRGAGLAWKTPASELVPHELVDAPDGYWNLGIAHGVPGIIAFCARCVAHGIEDKIARELLSGAVSYLLDAEPISEGGRYPAWHLDDGRWSGDRTRIAWCYGDLGVAVALVAAAGVDPRWQDDALRLARACASRPSQATVRDTGLCHGAAGIAHALNRIYQATGDAELGEAARKWFAMTLEMRTDHAYAGFPAFDAKLGRWREDATLMSGAAGVALVLQAAVSEIEPLWDRKLLLDVAPLD